jgi:ABC transporter substrate binding protein
LVRNNVPAIFAGAGFVRDGGLISYVVDATDLFRRAAGYVDRILRGERPADLPVQTPTKFDIAINLKTAKTLGLAVPPSLLALVDEVIEKANPGVPMVRRMSPQLGDLSDLGSCDGRNSSRCALCYSPTRSMLGAGK